MTNGMFPLQILNGDFLPTNDLYMKGMTLARCFRVLDSIVLGILIYLGALAFKRVVKAKKNQLAYCIQVRRLALLYILLLRRPPLMRACRTVRTIRPSVSSKRAPEIAFTRACYVVAGDHTVGDCLHADGTNRLLTGW